MSNQLKGLFKLCKARLSRSITLWVFASLILVEAIILIPSVYRRQQELLAQIPMNSSGKIAWILENYPHNSPQMFLEQLRNLHQLNPDVVGGSLYTRDGTLIGTFGERPILSYQEGLAGKALFLKTLQGDRYEVSCDQTEIQSKSFVVIIRHNAELIQPEIKAYILRIAGLVLIIAIVVTGTTLIVVGNMVIIPILKLRLDLIQAGQAISQNLEPPQFYGSSVQRQDELGDVIVAFMDMFKQIYEAIHDRIKAEAEYRLEKEKSEKLLLNILPLPIAEKLKQEQGCIAERFELATILFADITDFTGLASQATATQVVNLLNQIFSTFDRLADKHGLEKIKTIGDAYMVAGGIPTPKADHAEAIAKMALDMIEEIQQFRGENNQILNIRIGINTGPVVAGVIGIKKFSYDLWGDAVNIASRMESQGLPGKIQISQFTYELLKDKFLLEKRGAIQIKGKGEMITYWLLGKEIQELTVDG